MRICPERCSPPRASRWRMPRRPGSARPTFFPAPGCPPSGFRMRFCSQRCCSHAAVTGGSISRWFCPLTTSCCRCRGAFHPGAALSGTLATVPAHGDCIHTACRHSRPAVHQPAGCSSCRGRGHHHDLLVDDGRALAQQRVRHSHPGAAHPSRCRLAAPAQFHDSFRPCRGGVGVGDYPRDARNPGVRRSRSLPRFLLGVAVRPLCYPCVGHGALWCPGRLRPGTVARCARHLGGAQSDRSLRRPLAGRQYRCAARVPGDHERLAAPARRRARGAPVPGTGRHRERGALSHNFRPQHHADRHLARGRPHPRCERVVLQVDRL